MIPKLSGGAPALPQFDGKARLCAAVRALAVQQNREQLPRDHCELLLGTACELGKAWRQPRAPLEQRARQRNSNQVMTTAQMAPLATSAAIRAPPLQPWQASAVVETIAADPPQPHPPHRPMGASASSVPDSMEGEAHGLLLTPERATERRLEAAIPLRCIHPRSCGNWAVAASRGLELANLGDLHEFPQLAVRAGEKSDRLLVRALEAIPELTVFETGTMRGEGLPHGAAGTAFARGADVSRVFRFVDDIRIEVTVNAAAAGGTPFATFGIWSSSRLGTNGFGKNTARVKDFASRIVAHVGTVK